MIARAPGGRRHHVAKAPRFKVKLIDKRINETHRVIVSDIIIKPLREVDRFVAVSALDVAHSGRKLRHRNQSNECPIVWQTPEFLHSLALQRTRHTAAAPLNAYSLGAKGLEKCAAFDRD